MDQENPIVAVDEDVLACRLDVVEQASLMAEYSHLASTAVVGVRRAATTLAISVSRSSEAEGLVERIVEAERACCPFMRIAVDPEGGTLALRYSGPDAIGPVLDMIEARVRPRAKSEDLDPAS
jgi:hypothetical protein